MAEVLTTGSNVNCGHGGQVGVASQAKLTVNGQPALTKTSVAVKAISDCATPSSSDASGPVSKPCLNCVNVTAGEAARLTVGNEKVLLASALKGTTDGMLAKTTPLDSLAATAEHSRLHAQ